jgi:hypothetical protein
MRLEIMDRKYEWIPMPQSERQIKPRMETLVVDYVRREVTNLPHDGPDRSELPQGLPESGTPEGKQPHVVVQFLFVRVSKTVRQHEQNVRMRRQSVRQPNAILPKVGGNQGNAQALSRCHKSVFPLSDPLLTLL